MRSEKVLAHVDQVIELTKTADLPRAEVKSLLGSLEWLRKESITRTGRTLARELDGRCYLGERPDKFFAKCYTIRSDLVHGNLPRPPLSDVQRRAEALRVFVGDLLGRELL